MPMTFHKSTGIKLQKAASEGVNACTCADTGVAGSLLGSSLLGGLSLESLIPATCWARSPWEHMRHLTPHW